MMNTILAQIYQLPLHPKCKILLHSRHLFSKMSWHFTVADLSKTWVSANPDNIVASYVRKWQELPVRGTLRKVFLAIVKFDLRLYPPPVKFSQCQTVARTALWKSTSSHTNLQYDRYKDTKDVIKVFDHLRKRDYRLI